MYNFYNFLPHYYEYKHPNKPKAVQRSLRRLLIILGMLALRFRRRSGVLITAFKWDSLLVSFLSFNVRLMFMDPILLDPEKVSLNVPIVQLSLDGNEDPEKHYRLDQALESLRDESVLIIGVKMAIHNLHDFRKSRGSGVVMPYVTVSLLKLWWWLCKLVLFSC